jgi:CheY-specific phosphatase CheX
MKRFGGIDFLSNTNFDSFALLSETVIKQLTNLVTANNQTTLTIDPSKIAPLFTVQPPQASVY